jgi:type IV pilus assembly protein PilX
MKMTQSLSAQRGATLILSLVFLLLLTMLGVSSMQNATLQERMATSLQMRQSSFQLAESVLRAGEARVRSAGFVLPTCEPVERCGPPPEALTLTDAGSGGDSTVNWVAVDGGFYGLQNFAAATHPVGVEPANDATPWTLYRITAVAIRGGARTVLESVSTDQRRIMWRQRQ